MLASFKRVEPLAKADFVLTSADIVVQHQDGTFTVFGSEAAYEIFKQGLLKTNYTLYDEPQERWIVPQGEHASD